MGWTQRHGLTIGGAFLLLAPLWGALRYALELSGHAAFVQSIAYPGTTGAIVAMVLDPPGWAIALLIAIALLLFFFDTHLWQEMPEPATPIARRPTPSARKRAIERIVRRDNNGARSLQPTTTIKYPRAMRASSADKARGSSPSSSLMLRLPDFLADGLPLGNSDPGFVSTAALLERPAVKVSDIGFRSTSSLLDPDAEATRAEAALFPPPVGIFRHLSNDDLKQHTASMAQALRLFEQRFSENDNDSPGTAVFHGYHPNAVELAAEILQRVGRIPIPKDDVAVIGGAIVLQMGGPMGAWPFNSAANFLEFISGKLGQSSYAPPSVDISQGRS
jgi:hypothetical protein